jgi:hypothetical protein
MAWQRHAFDKLANGPLGAHGLAQLVSNRMITTSSACGGICTDMVADSMLESAAKEHLRSCGHGDVRPIKLNALYTIEHDMKCIEEILALPEPPDHIFGDLSDFVPTELRKPFGLDGGDEAPPGELRRMIASCTPLTKAWCYKHGNVCNMETSDAHRAGTSCKDHSNAGLRLHEYGPQAKFFWIWIALRKLLRDKMISHENVTSFGVALLHEELGSIYIIIRVVIDAVDLGWATERTRQCVTMLLKVWGYAVLKDF